MSSWSTTREERVMPERDDLVGAWELESWRISFSDGREDTFPHGADAQGQLIYDASGRMAVTVSAAGRSRVSDENIRKTPVEERSGAFDTFFHYAGRWNLGEGEVYHDVELSMNPNFVGTRQVRGVEWGEGKFTLVETSTTRSGAVMRNQLTWRTSHS